MTAGVPLAEVTRVDERTGTPRIESVHTGHLVVADAGGHVLGQLGDPDASTFLRSSVKPFQATFCLELLRAAGGDPSSLTATEVAVAWASHRAEPRHLAAVRSLAARSGTDPERLTCPAAVGEADPAATASRLRHNCSGKHALFALAGRALGVERAELLAREGPLQEALLAELEHLLGPPTAIGIDGCGAPAVAAPLRSLAVAFARLVTEDRFATARDAGLAHPGLVGGEGRLECALLASGVVAKSGAEGVHGVGWIGPGGQARGLAVKAADGGSRGAAAAVVGLLERLGVLPAGRWVNPPTLGGGEPVGQVRPAPEVTELAAARLAGH